MAIINFNSRTDKRMPLPRSQQISLASTPYYHCISRCVRRAYLCGKDKHSGQNYEHRRQWVQDRLFFLASVFTIDVCAFAIMHNHSHLVLHVNQKNASELSDIEVVIRWKRLHRPTSLVREFIEAAPGKSFTAPQMQTINSTIAIYRKRLLDISWFMRELNEFIARKANKEDNCTGHFWEGRFKSQALLDENALIACLAYVDLNPIRSGLAKSPSESNFTSIKIRLNDKKKQKQSIALVPFIGNAVQKKFGLPFNLKEYIDLIAQMANSSLVKNKCDKLIDATYKGKAETRFRHSWETLIWSFESTFAKAAGSITSLEKYRIITGRKRRPKIQNANVIEALNSRNFNL